MISLFSRITYIAFMAAGIFLTLGGIGGFMQGEIVLPFVLFVTGIALIFISLKVKKKKNKVINKSSSNTSSIQTRPTKTSASHARHNYDYLKVSHLVEDITVFDLETTGFNPENNEIIQIAAIKYRDNKIIDTFEKLVQPNEPISSKITELTGITNKMVENAPPLSDTLFEFYNFVQGETLVAHNANFDMRFLLTNLQRNHIEYERFKVIDTLALARKYIHDTKNHKLITLKEHLNIKARSHNAFEDCRVTGELYYYCKQIVDSQPGYHNGKHYTDYVSDIKDLKREKQNTEAIELLLKLVNEVESESKYKNHAPAPWYYEQLAILYRKEKMNGEEIGILERYFSICVKYGIPNGVKHTKLVDRHSKLVN